MCNFEQLGPEIEGIALFETQENLSQSARRNSQNDFNFSDKYERRQEIFFSSKSIESKNVKRTKKCF